MTDAQKAVIFTKHFVNKEDWDHATTLIGMVGREVSRAFKFVDASSSATPGVPKRDFWEKREDAWVRVHVRPRRALSSPHESAPRALSNHSPYTETTSLFAMARQLVLQRAVPVADHMPSFA